MDVIGRNHKLILEFLRHSAVGGASFLVDFGVFCLFREYILPEVNYSLFISNAFGFLCGLTVNYFLSVSFVFLSSRNTGEGRSAMDIVLFAAIALAGLIISEAGMYFGTHVLGFPSTLVKLVVSAVTLIWNYCGRKIMIFNNSRPSAARAAGTGETR